MNDIFEYVKQEQIAYSLPISLADGWEWNMKEHIRLSFLYKNSQFSTGNDEKNRDDKPFNNIVLPILNLQYRTEGFDVKDVTLYVDDDEQYFKSFLTKKYHDRWAIEQEMDTFIDEGCESVVDYGGTLVRDVNREKPEVVDLKTIAFCDQTNMLGGPIGIRHYYSPSDLEGMKSKGWGDKSKGATITIDEILVMARPVQKKDEDNGKENKTPGKYVEVIEVYGMLPESFLKDTGSSEKHVLQLQIVAFYFDDKGKKTGVKLYASRAPKDLFKQFFRNKIAGRALGRGGVEELFDSQVWTNYGEIAMKEMLDAAGKVILKTTDKTLASRHPTGLKSLDSMSILELEDGKDVGEVNTSVPNFVLFEKAVFKWQQAARTIGSANESIMGKQEHAGMPFKSVQLLNTESHGMHDYRRGKYAAFIGNKVYPDWILKWIVDDMTKGTRFLEELSVKELQRVADDLVDCQVEKVKREKVLNGEDILPADIEQLKQGIRSQFMKRGQKWFLEIFKDEMKDVPVKVRVNIVGKQKDLGRITDAIVNIIRQIIAAPQILQAPGMGDLFNEIIELGGLSPVDFSGLFQAPSAPVPSEVIPTPQPAPAYT